MKRLALATFLIAILSTILLAGSEPTDKPEPDPRLDQKVTIKAVGKPISDFCKELTAQTGVRFNARKDAADLKVAIFVKDVPLSSLKDSIRDCLHLMCTREGKKGEWTYYFWEDLKTEQVPERFRQGEMRRFGHYLDGLTQQIAEMESEGIDPAALVRELKSGIQQDLDRWLSSPIGALYDRFGALSKLSDIGNLPAMALYASLMPAQLQSLWQGQQVTVQLEDLDPGLRDRLAGFAAPFMDERRAEMERIGQKLDIGGLYAITLGIQGQESKPGLNYMLSYAVPDVLEGDRKPLGGSSGIIQLPAYTHEKEAEIRDLDVRAPKDSKKPVGLEVEEGKTPYEVLEMIHDEGRVCMVSDYFTSLTDTANFRISKGRRFDTWEQAAKFAAVKAGSDFSKHGEILVFRSKTWPVLRPREIPERLLVGWRKAREEYGGLRIQEAVQIAGLSSMQLEDLRLYKIGNGGAIAYQQALQFAGSLNANQWEQATTEQGLSLAGCTADQLDLAWAWIPKTGDASTDKAAREKLRTYILRIVHEPEGGTETELSWGLILGESTDLFRGRVAAGGIELRQLNTLPAHP